MENPNAYKVWERVAEIHPLDYPAILNPENLFIQMRELQEEGRIPGLDDQYSLIRLYCTLKGDELITGVIRKNPDGTWVYATEVEG